MKLKYAFIIAIIAGFFFVSCSSQEEKESLKKIEQMIAESDLVYETMNGTLLDSVNAYLDSANIKLSYFKENPGDTLPIEAENYWESYYHMISVRKMLGNYKDKHLPRLNQDFEYSKKQLENLHHDIKKGLLEDSVRISYMELEDSAYSFIMDQADARMNHVRAHFGKYSNNHEKLDTLLQIMQND